MKRQRRALPVGIALLLALLVILGFVLLRLYIVQGSLHDETGRAGVILRLGILGGTVLLVLGLSLRRRFFRSRDERERSNAPLFDRR